MDILTLTTFFKFLTITVGAIYLATAAMIIFAQDFLVSTQQKFIDIDKSSLNKLLYGYMAMFKILFIIFVVCPYMSLLLMD